MLGATDPTQVTMLLGACGILGTAIAALYRQQTTHFNSLDAKLKHAESMLQDCQDDRLAIWKLLAKQQGVEVEAIRGKQ